MAGDLAHNERLKLTATYVNGVAVATFALGSLAPLFSMLAAQTMPTTTISTLVPICFLMSVGLHLIARRSLRSLRE